MTLKQFDDSQECIRDKVVKLCQAHPEAKKDYRTLLQYFWYYEDGLKQYVPKEVLAKLTQPESVTRAFRKAVEEKRIVLDEDVKKSRSEKEKQFHSYYGKKRQPKVEWGF